MRRFAVGSAVDRVWKRLVEIELRSRLVEGGSGLGFGGIDLEGLVQEEVPLGRPPCRGDRRGSMGQIEVHEDGAERRRCPAPWDGGWAKRPLGPWVEPGAAPGPGAGADPKPDPGPKPDGEENGG